MLASLEEFAGLYARRPIKDNHGGMQSPHLFLFWFVLRFLRPAAVIESGVWHGQGTWFMEHACPDAELFCIDLTWKHLRYRSKRATYLDRDLAKHDWSRLPKERTVVFLDDHMDALTRCATCMAHGFKHLLIEDNYPFGRGDVYSLKEVLEQTGHRAFPGVKARINRALGRVRDRSIAPNDRDAAYVRSIADTYQELPPVFTTPLTRWGDRWEHYRTERPLLTRVDAPYQQVFLDEAQSYTWMCYVHLATRAAAESSHADRKQ
jgi:hypothetical protein